MISDTFLVYYIYVYHVVLRVNYIQADDNNDNIVLLVVVVACCQLS